MFPDLAVPDRPLPAGRPLLARHELPLLPGTARLVDLNLFSSDPRLGN